VVITDQLNNNLDWSTFELTEIGFGDQFIVVPPDTRHFQTTVSLSYNSVDFEVHIVVDLDLATGRLTACFYSIDPDTGLPPTVDIGFLPPEDGTGRGMGHISYIINTKTDLTTGTEIRNIALISFDNQPAIATNQVNPHDPSQGTDPSKECLNTIDAGAPTSQVSSLPAVTTTASFTVSWSGADDAGGSGIASYDIYVSDNGGPFTLWSNHTTLTQQTFSGATHHTYVFYSIARDNVGHVEAPPAVPDTTTAVNVGPSAEFSATPVTGNEPFTTTFGDLSSSQDGIISWLWNFGDGTTSTERNPTHCYAHDGTYTVTLTVTDGDGSSDTVTKTAYITVTDVGPKADFSYTAGVNNKALTVAFADLSSSYDGIVSWLWDFGDGATSTEQNPTHAYPHIGKYSVTLRITEADGNTETKQEEVVVPIGNQIFYPGTAVTMTSADGRIAIDIPEGCFSSETWISILAEESSAVDSGAPSGFKFGSTFFRIEAIAADGTTVSTLLQSATITVWYSDDDLAAGGGDLNGMVLAHLDESSGEWITVGTTVNTADNTLSVATTHLSHWAVLAKVPSQGLSTWIWIVIGIGAALGVAILAYLVRRRLSTR
jgi:PKD repeat protein